MIYWPSCSRACAATAHGWGRSCSTHCYDVKPRARRGWGPLVLSGHTPNDWNSSHQALPPKASSTNHWCEAGTNIWRMDSWDTPSCSMEDALPFLLCHLSHVMGTWHYAMEFLPPQHPRHLLTPQSQPGHVRTCKPVLTESDRFPSLSSNSAPSDNCPWHSFGTQPLHAQLSQFQFLKDKPINSLYFPVQNGQLRSLWLCLFSKMEPWLSITFF